MNVDALECVGEDFEVPEINAKRAKRSAALRAIIVSQQKVNEINMYKKKRKRMKK